MTPYYTDEKCTIYHGDCREVLPHLKDVDSVVTDPPYAEIDRDYGRWTEQEWHALMREVVDGVRSSLKASGSAVFVLQPNSEKVGRMRPWLWEFMAWTSREWNQVQDAWWWNHATPPTVHCHAANGLLRPSLKACVWLGDPKCYRDQSVVLWSESEANEARRAEQRFDLTYTTSKLSMRSGRCCGVAAERGGVTPFNVLPAANTDSSGSAGAKGHGAGTPHKVADWWTRYITPDGGLVVDPFCGSGTMAEVAKTQGLRFVGIEKEERYCEIIAKRLGSFSTLF